LFPYTTLFRSEFLERGVEVRLIEAAESRLVDSDIARLRLELVYNISPPVIPDQNATLSPVRCANCLADPEFQMARPVHRVRRAEVRQVRLIRHSEINDFHARRASRRQHFGGGCDRLLRA